MIGNKIREIRTKQNLSMKGLATMCGTSSSYISDLENGYIKKPSADKLLKIADALGVSINELLNRHTTSNNIGFNIKSAKIFNQLTDEQLSRKTGIDEIQLRAIQDGKVNPTKSQLDLIAKTLNLPVEKFLEGSSVNIDEEGNIKDKYDINSLIFKFGINKKNMSHEELCALIYFYEKKSFNLGKKLEKIKELIENE